MSARPIPTGEPVSDERFNDPKLAINRVYTRKGDAGETRLVGGQLIPKDDLRIECYGTVDELNSAVGAARLSCLASDLTDLAADLQRIQNALFNLGSLLATLSADLHPKQPRVQQGDVDRLEAAIDRYNGDLPALRSFVLPGGTRANVELHLCRTLCRRAERLCVRLGRQTADLDPFVIPYLNRLSDAFFVFARHAVHAVRA
ncbi:MAG: cob(I)yrinic acid a,c-diamide adenosyltransferase, partial [Myxococcales bacterium]|nr:cob(I)yrinic acid a,c-diamide adenosyltransferase [Myxococcales bacterium]